MLPILKFSDLDLSKQYSYADYLTWQFAERVELIKGWIYKMSPAPSSGHQDISGVFYRNIYEYLVGKNCKLYYAPFDVRLIDSKKSKSDKTVYTVVQPDLCIICDLTKIDEKGCIGSPDLIIEILSPGNTKRDLKTKFELYQENGVKEYWIAHPTDKNIMLFTLIKNKYVLHQTFFDDDVIESKLFKGLKINVAEIFAT
jgi:Uma2 family endonuclease